jgi:ferrochelatase
MSTSFVPSLLHGSGIEHSAMSSGRRIAVVFFNLGGPDSLDAVEPFLVNLFSDPAIIRVPRPLRSIIARQIARRRLPVARCIYARMGGASPLLPNTEAQARALEERLKDLGEVRVFCCMRYWHPLARTTAAAVASFRPTETVLLPLYPQFSSTTTASSYRVWWEAASTSGLASPGRLICCYPTAPGFITAALNLIREGISRAEIEGGRRPRVLFSAHGLPKRFVARGDPYRSQVERSALIIAEKLGLSREDWVVCYQSRVGPLEWIKPYTDDEIRRAGADGIPVVVFPIAFVSEHSETLVELDIDYRRLAEQAGVPSYVRVPAVGTAPEFIAGLADLVRRAVVSEQAVCSASGSRLCAASERCCPHPAA